MHLRVYWLNNWAKPSWQKCSNKWFLRAVKLHRQHISENLNLRLKCKIEIEYSKEKFKNESENWDFEELKRCLKIADDGVGF